MQIVRCFILACGEMSTLRYARKRAAVGLRDGFKSHGDITPFRIK